MNDNSIVNRTALLCVIALISGLFLLLIGRFLIAIFLAGLVAALFHPAYLRLSQALNGRRALAATITLIMVLLFILTPLALVIATVATQAQSFAQNALPELQQMLQQQESFSERLQGLPFYTVLAPYQEFISARLAEGLGKFSGSIVDLAQSATVGTFSAVLTLLIVLYTFFYLLMDGDRLVYLILLYLPLDDDHEQRLLNRFRSVTLATLKGTAVIGFLQGGLAGAAMAVAGVPQALLWGFTMMLLSIVPGIGAALVWLPACVYLVIQEQYITAAALFAFCALLVGSIDNLLRPKLVGSDTQLHELMIFFSTLGGLLTFGIPGFVIGPIIAALFVTVWDIYGSEFRQWLPGTGFQTQDQLQAQDNQPDDPDRNNQKPESINQPNPHSDNQLSELDNRKKGQNNEDKPA